MFIQASKTVVKNDRGPDYAQEIWSDEDYPTKEGDGHLIAAAPDLLSACKGMIDAYWRGSEDSDDDDAPSMVKDALAAIAKAEGR